MEILLLKATLVFYLLSTAAFILPLISTRAIPRALGPGLLLAAFVCHASAIVIRSAAAGYIAVTNFYEAVSLFACLTAGLCLRGQSSVRSGSS
jgi:ABC-type transport system involved in cytochrome c biogenesis permease subunit